MPCSTLGSHAGAGQGNGVQAAVNDVCSRGVRSVGTKPLTWKRKVNVYNKVYKGFGCSDGEVVLAFVMQPTCMLLSNERIRQAMEFFVEKVLCYSLEKRVLPRFEVLGVLQFEGFSEQ